MMHETLSWLQGPGGWLILGLLLLILEFVVPGLVLIFFGLGALLTALLLWAVDMSLTAQILVFCVSSVVMLLGLRRFTKPVLFGQSSSAPDEEELIGQHGRVTRSIAPPDEGRVQLHGVEWSAVASEPLAEGCSVEVTGRDNLTLTVTPLR